ncbi:hypothetical protein DAH69_18410 [Sphingomonas koreensis]|nr:hypothetical protein DAH69_18410 [Sphingomonas koreensis]
MDNDRFIVLVLGQAAVAAAGAPCHPLRAVKRRVRLLQEWRDPIQRAVSATKKREADPRGAAAAKPAKPARPRVDDDAGPLLDRPKRHYRSNDRRPRPSAKPGPGKRGPRK